MNIWIISDTHFGHDKLKEYTNRPDGVEWKIMKNTENSVKEGDILIHLGDFCIGRDEYWHEQFITRFHSQKKILIRGNHDRKSFNWYMNKWDFVCESLEMDMYGKKILLSHVPKKIDDFIDLNIHGHLHNHVHRSDERINDKKHYLLSLELNGYRPETLRSIIENYERKNKA